MTTSANPHTFCGLFVSILIVRQLSSSFLSVFSFLITYSLGHLAPCFPLSRFNPCFLFNVFLLSSFRKKDFQCIINPFCRVGSSSCSLIISFLSGFMTPPHRPHSVSFWFHDQVANASASSPGATILPGVTLPLADAESRRRHSTQGGNSIPTFIPF